MTDIPAVGEAAHSGSPPMPPKCLIIGHQRMIHRLDEGRSRPTKKWSLCSFVASGEFSVVPLVLVRDRYAGYSFCLQCFPNGAVCS